jgi:hypothetical protein
MYPVTKGKCHVISEGQDEPGSLAQNIRIQCTDNNTFHECLENNFEHFQVFLYS